MENIKYGVPEIIASFLGAFLIVVVEWMEKYAIYCGFLPLEVYNWIQFRVLVVSLVAVFFGPVAGIVCGIGGDMLINVILETSISYTEVITMGFFGFFLGKNYDRFMVREGRFGMQEYFDFNVISIMTGISAGVMIMPLLSFLIAKSNLFATVTVGIKSVVGNSVINAIVCGIAMAVASNIFRKLKKKKYDI